MERLAAQSPLPPVILVNTRRNLFRMRQFSEAYPDPQSVTALLTQLLWTQNIIILSRIKCP